MDRKTDRWASLYKKKQRGIISYIKCDIQSEKESGGGGYYTTTDLAQSKNPEYGDVERIELSANSKKK